MKFTDKQIATLKAKESRYELLEGDGLTIRVSPGGTKTWQHVWKKDGRTHRHALGRYPEMSLSDAREANRQCLSDRHHGIDPRGDKSPPPSVVTVADICAAHVEWAKLFKRRWQDDERYLTVEVVEKIGTLPADKLTRRMVVELLDAIVQRGSPVSANNLLKTWRRAWNVGIEKGLVETSPFTMVKNPAPSVKKSRTLNDKEIAIFWRVVSTEGRISLGMRNLLKFILVTAQRPGECNGYRYGEVKDGWWIIPPERHKQHKAHAVFLSPLAGSLTRYQNTPYGFDVRAVARCVRRLIDSGALPLAPFTPHDLRRTAATHLGSMGYSNEQIARVLGHTVGGVTAIYNRHAYQEEIKGMMLAWEARLNLIVGTNCAASGGEDAPVAG